MRRSLQSKSVVRYTVFALLLAILAVFLLWPIALTVVGGFHGSDGRFTLRYFGDVFRDPVAVRGLVNSFVIATLTTALSLAIALPLALLAVKREFLGKAVLTSLVMAPLVLPPFVGAIGLRAILGRAGALNAVLWKMGLIAEPPQGGIDFLGGAVGGRLFCIVVMEALHLYPILYLNLTAALANLDPALSEAAAGLGAGKWLRFRRVILPLIMPGLFAGATIVWVWSFTELGTPLMFDYYAVTPVQVFSGLQEITRNPRPYAMVVVMLAIVLGMYLLSKAAVGGRSYATAGKASIASSPKRLSGMAGIGAAALFTIVTLLALLPHAGVLIASFSGNGSWYRSALPTVWTTEHYASGLRHELVAGSIRNSLSFSLAAAAATTVLGLAIAHLTVRAKVRGGWLLDGLAMLPLAVPGLVMAVGYVALSLSWPFNTATLAPWFNIVGGTPSPVPFLIIAYTIRRLPYVVRAAAAGLQQTPVQLEEAAANLGAPAWYTLLRVTLPLIAANLIAGCILAFSFSMLEVSDSLILAQKQQHFPITKAIYEFYQRLGDGPYLASAMGVWAMALLAVTMIGAGMLMGKRMGAMFRA